jgi:hypothetical protein
MVEELAFAEVWAGAHSCGDALCSSMTSRWPGEVVDSCQSAINFCHRN